MDLTDRRPVRLACYQCDPREITGDSKLCGSVAARVVDRLIEAELLRALVPPSTELIREAAREVLREHEALVRARKDELRRAEQLVAERERAWDQVEETRPRLKRRLRDRLEEALADHETVRTSHALNPPIPPLTLDEAELAELRRLLEDLPTLWRHPSVTPEQRKTLVRRVVRVIRATRGPEAWLLEIEWVGGARTSLELVTYQGVRAELERAHQEGLGPKEIADHFNERGIVQRVGAGAGTPYTEGAVRALILKMGLQRPFDEAAYAYIRARFLEGATCRAIADELNARGIRHYLGKWTETRVCAAVRRLRRGRIPGIEPLPETSALQERVRTLHHAGLSARAIALRLRQEGVLTRHRRPVTTSAVLRVLRCLRLRSHSATEDDRLIELLKEWASTATVREITQRVNALGLRTMYGNAWIANNMNRKLAALGLRVPKKRRMRQPRQRRTS